MRNGASAKTSLKFDQCQDLGHTSAVYATDQDVIDSFSQAIRTGRILVNAPTAVGAMGGVYNSLTPTFSLGCGTWGGSATNRSR